MPTRLVNGLPGQIVCPSCGHLSLEEERRMLRDPNMPCPGALCRNTVPCRSTFRDYIPFNGDRGRTVQKEPT